MSGYDKEPLNEAAQANLVRCRLGFERVGWRTHSETPGYNGTFYLYVLTEYGRGHIVVDNEGDAVVAVVPKGLPHELRSFDPTNMAEVSEAVAWLAEWLRPQLHPHIADALGAA